MPPTGYLTITGIRSAMQHVATTYPDLAEMVELPERSHENRRIYAIKVAKGTGGDRRGVLFLGGVHARELINPDLLVSLALRLCEAYTSGSALVFGGKTFQASTVKLIVEGLDVWMIPLVNPDGRRYVERAGGDPWWRKNRSPNAGQPCMGVDLNRNCDFLWSSGIGTSTDSCSHVFRGSAAFSEPETRNVRHVLDAYPNIGSMIDVHSYSELILFPWGDDDNQTADPSMTFTNAGYDGLRGTPGDSVYREYVDAGDLDWYVRTGASMRDAIAAVRGHTYTVKQSVLLYPTTGTTKDYAYSRHIVDTGRRKVFAYTLETGREFQPAYSEALQVIDEGSAGLLQFCLAAICAVETVVAGTAMAARLDTMRAFRDEHMVRTKAGRRYLSLLQRHSAELIQLVADDDDLRAAVVDTMAPVVEALDATAKPLDPRVVKAVDNLADRVEKRAGRDLRGALSQLRGELRAAEGKSVLDLLGPEREGRREQTEAGD